MARKNDVVIRAGITGKEAIKNDLGEIVGYVENYANKLQNADFSVFNKLTDKLQRADFSVAGKGMQEIGKQTELTRQQAMALTYTFNDVTASLASGISPMTILAQQGGNLTQAFGGLRATIATIGPMLAKWAGPLAALGAAAGAAYLVTQIDEKGNAAAKKINDIGDAAKKAKVSTDELQGVMKALVDGGDAPSDRIAEVAAEAIVKLKNTVQDAKKAQDELKKDKPVFAKRLAVPGPGENPFEKAAADKQSFFKRIQPPAGAIDPGASTKPYKEGQAFKTGVEIDKLDIQKKYKKAVEETVPRLTQTNAELTKGTDLFSRLNIELPSNVRNLKAMIPYLVEVQRRFQALPEGNKKFDIEQLIEKGFPKLDRIIKEGTQADLLNALSGKVDNKYRIPPEMFDAAKRIDIQQNQQGFLSNQVDIRKGGAYLGVAEAANRDALRTLDEEAGKITTLDRAWQAAAKAKLDYYNIKANETGPDASASALAKTIPSLVGGAAYGAANALGALSTTPNLVATEAPPQGWFSGVIEAIGELAFQAAQAAGALKTTADAAKQTNASAFPDYSGGSGNSGYAVGGFVSGPGTSTSDSIAARLSAGEYVVRAAAVRRYGVGLFNAINGMVASPRGFGFANGGLVSPSAAAIGGGSASNRGLTLVLDGNSFGGMSGSSSAMDALERYAISRRLSSTTKRTPSRVG